VNIPDDVVLAAEMVSGGDKADYKVIAEWARREALKEAAEQVRDYWDACGELIDSNNGARLAFEAVAAQITEGAN
jgi:hypothetical protein